MVNRDVPFVSVTRTNVSKLVYCDGVIRCRHWTVATFDPGRLRRRTLPPSISVSTGLMKGCGICQSCRRCRYGTSTGQAGNGMAYPIVRAGFEPMVRDSARCQE